MSKIFYDHLVVFEDIDKEIKQAAKTPEEREELWQLVDEIVHHKVLEKILDELPKKNHEEFLGMFEETPYDNSLMDYLNKKVKGNIEEIIKQEIGSLAFELLDEIRGQEKK